MSSVTTKCTHCSAVLRLKDQRYIGREIRCPKCEKKFTVSRVADAPRRQSRESTESSTSASQKTRSARRRQPNGRNALPEIRTEEPSPSVTARHGRRRRSLVPSILFFCGIVAVAGGTAWWASQRQSEPPATATAVTTPPDDLPPPDEPAAPTASDAAIASPTDGTPVSMDYIPVVPQLLLHLRPANIWSDDAQHREFVATLGDLGTWLHDFMVRMTRFEPQEIEELTVAVNFGARTGPPDVAVVARLVNEHRESELLLERIQGTLMRDLSEEVYETEELAFMVVDRRTVVSASLDLAEDLAESKQYAAVPSPEMEGLLESSDRSRHVTLLLDLPVFDAHKDLLLKPQLQDLTEDAFLWLGTDCHMLSWSLHLDPHLYLQTTVIPAAELGTRALHRRLEKRLVQLPDDLLAAVRQMQPRTVGRQKIVGRFPAMMQALVSGTQLSLRSDGTTLTTLLPQKAAANLAAGATLTWNETARSDSGMPPVATRPAAAKTVAQRLQKTVLIDFRRTPLHEALSYIAGEIQVKAVIDGDALKIAGLTQNMAQTHNLGEVTAVKALDTILQQYDGIMVIVINEDRGSIQLTTQEAATRQGLTVFNTASQQ